MGEDIRMIRMCVDTDGETIDATTFDAVDAADDPAVVSRMMSAQGHRPREVITEYRATAARPAEFPAELPFLPEVATWVTAYPGGEMPPGARWICSAADADRVLAEVVAQSQAAGWEIAAPPAWHAQLDSTLLRGAPVFLRRGSFTRDLLTVAADSTYIVQLLDVAG